MIYGHGNCEFSISSTNYATQYRTPDNMKNQTRKRHNEVVSDRIVYNEEIGELEKEKPAYVFWIKENKEEKRERNKKWKMTKKASEQLGIPIVIIDKESILEKEEQKIENFKEIFAGRKENLQNLSDEQLLRKIIVEFENNCVGNHSTNKKYKENKYFSNENRINLIHFIEEELVRMEEEEPERYFTCLKDLMEIMNEEFFKHGEQATFYYEKARGIEEKIKNHNDNIKLKDSILIDSQDILRSKRTAELENVAVEIVKLHENQATIESTITIENSPNDVEGR